MQTVREHIARLRRALYSRPIRRDERDAVKFSSIGAAALAVAAAPATAQTGFTPGNVCAAIALAFVPVALTHARRVARGKAWT